MCTVHGDTRPVEIEYHQKMHAASFLNSLFRLKEFLCDVTLIVENKRLNCHKIILAAESPYFRTMFESNLKEAKENEISIGGITFSSLEAVVGFFYSSRIKLTEDNICEILNAVDLLQVTGLKPLCDKFLREIISTKNCVGLYSLGRRYGYHDVAATISCFIIEHFHRIIFEEDFLDAPFDAVFDVCDSLVRGIVCESQLCLAIRLWINYRKSKGRDDFLPESWSTFDESARKTFWLPASPDEINERLSKYGVRDDRHLLELINCKFENASTIVHLLNEHKVSSSQACFVFGGLSCDSEGVPFALRNAEVLVNDCDWRNRQPTFSSSDAESILPVMSHPRSYPAVAVASDQRFIYVIGGSDGDGSCNALDHVECYNVVTNQWRSVARLPYPLVGAAATYLNKTIYVTGGYNQHIGINNKVWLLHEECQSWHEGPPMLHNRSYHCLCNVNGVLYAIGGSGESGETLTSAECLFAGQDFWIQVEPLLTPRSHFACVLIGNEICAVFGKDSIHTIEKYNIESDFWRPVLYEHGFMIGRHGHTAVMLRNHIYVIGGCDTFTRPMNSVNRLNVNAGTDMWHVSGSLVHPRIGHVTATCKLYRHVSPS